MDPIVIRELVNPPDRRERVILVVDHNARRGLDIGHGQSVDPRQRLCQGHDAPNRQDLRGHRLSQHGVAVNKEQIDTFSASFTLASSSSLMPWVRRTRLGMAYRRACCLAWS